MVDIEKSGEQDQERSEDLLVNTGPGFIEIGLNLSRTISRALNHIIERVYPVCSAGPSSGTVVSGFDRWYRHRSLLVRKFSCDAFDTSYRGFERYECFKATHVCTRSLTKLEPNFVIKEAKFVQ